MRHSLFTFWKPYFWQNSHFQILIFHKIHNFKGAFFTKFTFSNIKFLVISGQNVGFCLCVFCEVNVTQYIQSSKHPSSHFSKLSSHEELQSMSDSDAINFSKVYNANSLKLRSNKPNTWGKQHSWLHFFPAASIFIFCASC